MKLNRELMPYELKRYDSKQWDILNKNGGSLLRFTPKRLGNQNLKKLSHTPINGHAKIQGVFMFEYDSDTETPEYWTRLKLLNNLIIKQI